MLSMTAYIHVATYYVAQNAPNASDENPGREETPWKTLAHAAEMVQEKDTVYIKAGAYREKLELTGDGVTFCAFGDDKVVLVADDSITLIEPSAWSKTPDSEHVYVCEPGIDIGNEGKGKILRVDGRAIAFELTQGARREMISGIAETREVQIDRILGDDDLRRWSVRGEKLYLNLGGEDPANPTPGVRVELIEAGAGGVVLNGKNCRVKSFFFHNCPISISGEGNIVSDCLSQESDASVSGQNIIRRCAFYRGRSIHIGTNAVFEENLVVGFGRWVPSKEPPQVAPQMHYGGTLWGRAIGGNVVSYELIRYNVIADSALWGFWNDCTGNGAYLYGNTFWRNWSGAIYNEDGCHDTRILYNALVENGAHGIMLSGANRVFIAYNLIAKNTRFGIGSSLTRQWPNPLDNVVQHNLITGSTAALMFEGKAPLQGRDMYQLMTNNFDHNIYSLLPGGMFARPDIATLADFQKLTKMDQNSRMDPSATMEDFGLGTVTFRIPDCDHPEKPVPMVANLMSLSLHQEPVGQDSIVRMDCPFFWNFGDGNMLPNQEYKRIYAPPWQFGRPFQRHGRWKEDAIPGAKKPEDGEQPFWLEASSENPDAVSEDGSGWWSRSLPTVEGAHIRVSLKVSGEHLEPTEGQAVVAFLRFSSFTDQHVACQYLIGGDKDEEILTGTFTWKTFSKEFVAPPEARRFALFFGVRPCTGKTRVAAVRISTLPGEKRAETLMPEDATYEPIDLKDFFNRKLDENVTGRLVEGWPGRLDLSQLPRGEQIYEKVPFQIDKAISLRGSMFPQEKGLPREVRGIPVGFKVAGLYFLHCVVYPARDREQFRYILRLTDGGVVELPAISGWEMVKGKYQQNNIRIQSSKNGTNLMEWVNPQPEVAIESIDFVGADTGEPVLLAITAAVKESSTVETYTE